MENENKQQDMGSIVQAMMEDDGDTAPANGNVNEPPTAEQIAESAPESMSDDDGDGKNTEGGSLLGGADADSDVKKDADTTEAIEESSSDNTYDIKLPDGVELDNDFLLDLTPVFKDKKLTNDDVQAITDIYIEHMQARQQRAEAEHAKMRFDWARQAKSDPEYGGDNFATSLKTAKGVLEKYGNEALIQELDRTGLGDNAEMIRMLVKIGNRVKDDSVPQGSAATTKELRNLEDVVNEMYIDMK